MISAIEDRFKQPGFAACSQLEDLLHQHLRSEDISDQVNYVKYDYADDINVQQLLPQLDIFKIMINKDANKQTVTCFQDILASVKKFSPAQKHLVSEVIIICTLLLVNPATSAVRANMHQQRFNNISLLRCS